jgi:hypothetical protein
MRVAICLSGQPRTWEKCHLTWHKLIETIKANYKVESVDIFFHMWDYNTPPHRLLMHEGWDYMTVPGELISEDEKHKIVSSLNPIAFLFEDEISNKNKIQETRDRNFPHINEHGITKLEWCAGQFYSIMHACHLKKKYEYDNDFRYDVCIRMRTDMFFEDYQIKHFVSKDLAYPDSNTFYSCHTAKDDIQFPFHRLGDVFWYADSVTFNRICEFYRWLPIIGQRTFNNNLIGTEHALYFYAKMFNIEISPLSFDPKIYRGQDYLNRKMKSGLEGELGGHELI